MRERIRQYLERTHGVFFELVRHFFLRLFDTDLVTEPGRMQNLVVGSLSALAALTCYMPIAMFRKYVDLTSLPDPSFYHQHAVADRLLYTFFPMLIVGFVGALLWQSLFPTEEDYRVLMPLPISRWQLFLSKLTALSGFVVLFVIAVIAFPTVFLPLVQESKYALLQSHWQAFVGHTLAAGGGALFVFFSLLTVQGLLMNLLGPRWFPRVSLLVQAALLLALLTMLPQVFNVAALYRTGKIPPETAQWFPPFWFHGIYEVMVGRPEAIYAERARVAVTAFFTVIGASIALYWISYQRVAVAQSESGNKVSFAALESLFRWLLKTLRRPREEHAIVSFVLKTLARSRQHKLLLSAYLGCGVAVLVNFAFIDSWDTRYARSIETRQVELLHSALSAPLVISFFLLSGVRAIFAIPVSLESNWIFRMLESNDRLAWLNAVETAFAILGLSPLLLSAPLFLVPVAGWSLVIPHIVVCALLTLILIECMLWEWQKVPFVCSYLPGKKNVAVTVVGYWIAFSAYAFSTTRFELACLRDVPRMMILVGLLIATLAKLREFRLERWGVAPLRFEEAPDEVVETLRLARP
ncbi:MAG: hypothetical protein HY820_35980 [Acidobacteria bacterium]|nr:hypothetical protein [Acidobacteriota bacterium]